MLTLNSYKTKGIEDYGGCISPDFKNFSRLYRNYLKRMCGKNNWTIVNFTVGHYYCSWFIKDENDRHIYMSFSDVRHFSKSWYNIILYRTAQNASDYRGGTNWYTDMNNMEKNLKQMFARGW